MIEVLGILGVLSAALLLAWNHRIILARLLNLKWSTVRRFFTDRISASRLSRRGILLEKSGVSSQQTSSSFTREVLSTLGGLAIGLIGWQSLGLPSYFVLTCGAAGYFLPAARLNNRIRRRQREILMTLPYYLDLLTLAMEAGMDLVAAVDELLRTDSDNALREELAITLKSIQMGSGRADAFRKLADRTGVAPLTILASAVAQSEELGSSLGNLLRLQAESIRRQIFREAEERAQRAPLQMLLPLIVFIFPVTFLLLMAPILLQIVQ